ncbi:transposase [Laribacter hongkongensis]|uniref:transposase n=1 Tax=Laribacter hongkongensis TaxID=168471 RepID=UPI001EFD08F7|nr:transposase [Laribacter hongkongensis]
MPASTQRNERTGNAQIKQGETPEDWSARKLAHKDVDARWTMKHGKPTFGCKLSVSTDCRYKLIRTVHVSPANEGDQTHLLMGARPEQYPPGLVRRPRLHRTGHPQSCGWR